MQKKVEGIAVPKFKTKRVVNALADWLGPGPCIEAEAVLRDIEGRGKELARIEADLALAFMDLVQRMKGRDTLPKLIVDAVKGGETAKTHLELTAENATDAAAKNLAASALAYMEKLQRWDDIK
jgi:hypothetical protein